MSTPSDQTSGLSRSANLLRALGANAAPVWAELDAEDAAAIARAMDAPQQPQSTAATPQARAPQPATSSVWQRMSDLPTHTLSQMLENEHPQVIALALSRMVPSAAAAVVRQTPALLATDVLHRMLHMSEAHTSAMQAIERAFATQLDKVPETRQQTPDETVARIFDALPSETGEALLSGLQKHDDGARARVRALMFSFEDIAALPPGALQTLLARANRAHLILALKGENGPVTKALFANMTARAQQVLAEEIASLPPQKRADVDRARAELASLTRTLMDAGEIRAKTDIDEDLIE